MALMAAMQILNRMREQGQNRPGSTFQQPETQQPAVDLSGADYPVDDSGAIAKDQAEKDRQNRQRRRENWGNIGSAVGRYMSSARPNPGAGFGGQ